MDYLVYLLERPKDGSLEINSLALESCFSYRNIFQNGVNFFVKNGFKKTPVFLVQKAQNFV